MSNDATDPPTDEMVMETTLTENKKKKELPKASKTYDPKDRKRRNARLRRTVNGRKQKRVDMR